MARISVLLDANEEKAELIEQQKVNIDRLNQRCEYLSKTEIPKKNDEIFKLSSENKVSFLL